MYTSVQTQPHGQNTQHVGRTVHVGQGGIPEQTDQRHPHHEGGCDQRNEEHSSTNRRRGRFDEERAELEPPLDSAEHREILGK